MFERLRLPSPSLTVAWIALAVALGGTAVAATATLVKITDNSGTRVAVVDFQGRLRAAAFPVAPTTPFFSFAYADASGATLLGPSKATAVLTSMNITNEIEQVNGAKIRVSVTIGETTGTNCYTANFRSVVGVYNVAAGETLQLISGPGVVLKPQTAGNAWCLRVSMSVQGNPGSYYLAPTSVAGYVDSGKLALASAVASAEPVLAQRRGR